MPEQCYPPPPCMAVARKIKEGAGAGGEEREPPAGSECGVARLVDGAPGNVFERLAAWWETRAG